MSEHLFAGPQGPEGKENPESGEEVKKEFKDFVSSSRKFLQELLELRVAPEGLIGISSSVRECHCSTARLSECKELVCSSIR